MIEELDCFSIEWEVICCLIEEEMNGMRVEFQGQGFEERDVIRHDLFVRKVELVLNDTVDVVIGQQIICRETRVRKSIRED